MKIKGAKQVHYDSGPNMTPLVDVVMVILIFLMLAGSFAGASHFLASNLPFNKTGKGQADMPPSMVPTAPLDVRVELGEPTAARDTTIPLRSRHTFTAVIGGNIKAESPAALNGAMVQKYNEYKKNGIKPDDIQIQIKPNAMLEYKDLILAYEAILEDFQADDADPSKPHPLFTKVAFSTSH